jgi:hypothetical protein
MKPTTLSQLWDEYSREVLTGIDPGSIQYQEMQKAFYAGALRLLMFFYHDLSQRPEEEGVRILGMLTDEGGQFFEALANEH